MKNFIRLCILNPVAILALVMLTVVFGIVALKKIPIQMTPDIDKPILQVRVSWPGASPDDVEREIITRLERSISSLSGIEKIELVSDADISWLNVDIGLLRVYGTPTNNDIGEAKFDAVVSYSDGSEVLKSFVFDVKEINDAPTLLSDQLVTVDEDSSVTTDVLDNDTFELVRVVGGFEFFIHRLASKIF